MKKIFVLLLITAFGLNILAFNTSPNLFIEIPYGIDEEWVKTDHWVCKDNMTWFKYDKSAKQLWKSIDEGETWKKSPDGLWNDYNGNFLKIENGKVMQTTSSKAPWTEVEGWKWKGGDGNWYKLDKEWDVWKMK